MEFKNWLLIQESALVDRAVAASYERGLQDGLTDLIARIRDPGLKSTLERMKECPVKDPCRSFTDYITGTLIRNRCGLADPEESFASIYRQLMSPVNLQGQPRATLFGNFDESKPFTPGTDRRQFQHGNLSIVPHKGRENLPGAVAADEIPARDHGDDGRDLRSDIQELLRIRQGEHPGIPLIDLFNSILSGETVPVQKAKFGGRAVEVGRKVIVQAVGDYARSTENWGLMRLLDKISDPMPAKSRRQPKPAKAKLEPDQQDYASIISVMERNGRTASLGLLQKTRRRWSEWKPRDPTSPHSNRLDDVLARMVSDGVLEERRTRKGGRYYVPGQNYQRYLAGAEV
jgi:hypothetical protein